MINKVTINKQTAATTRNCTFRKTSGPPLCTKMVPKFRSRYLDRQGVYTG